jgi:hypothetical protein
MEPSEPLSYDQVSRVRPLFIQGFGCEGVGHEETMTVPSLGCLLFAPPSALPDTVYPFNRSFLFLEFDGLGIREPHGRWNSGTTVQLRLLVDIRRVWAYSTLYVTLGLNPYLPPGTPRQRVGLSWGRARRADVTLRRPEHISLPVERQDWRGIQEWTVPITLEFPDAVGADWMYGPQGRVPDRGPLAAVFEDVSIGRRATGRVISSERPTD